MKNQRLRRNIKTDRGFPILDVDAVIRYDAMRYDEYLVVIMILCYFIHKKE